MNTRNRGIAGENFACLQLAQEGYTILERNWRSGRGEVDIIAQKGDVLAFIEVKTRRETALESPLAAVSKGQRRRVILTAVAYLKAHGIYNTGTYQPRFDLFAVVTAEDTAQVVRFDHLKGVYTAEGLHVFV